MINLDVGPLNHWGPTDLGSALLLGIVIALVPLAIAYWPSVVALTAERRQSDSELPAGTTPYVTCVLSDLSETRLFACGLQWLIARKPSGGSDVGGQAASESSAESCLRDLLCPPGSLIADAREEARHLLASNDPTTYEMRAALPGLRGCSKDDARNLGLLRNSALISRFLGLVAACELVLALIVEGGLSISQTLLCAGLITAVAALHVNERSLAGALLTGRLRRLRADLRKAALATGAVDVEAVRSLVPVVTTAAEAEVWAVSAGCRTAGSEQAAARVRSIAHAEEGRPRVIRYTEAMTHTGEELVESLVARVKRLGRRRESNGATPVLW